MMDKLHCPECGIEIDEHPAGRCLDAWVAITIMNWKYAPKTDPKIKLWLYWRRPDGMLKYEPPEYSTDIAAAWEVVEKMQKPNWAWHIESFYADGELRWWVLFWGDDEEGNIFDDGKGDAKTISLAICRAAIKDKAG